MKVPARYLVLFLVGAVQTATAKASEDSLGPVARWRGHTLVDPSGVQAAAGVDLTPYGGNAAWRPQWFTAKGAGASSTVFLQRRLTVSSAASLKQATAWVSADRVYRLWINGKLVSRGPDDPGFDVGEKGLWTHQWLYNTVDLAPYIHPGSNLISAEVVNSSSSSAFSLGKTGFAFQAALGYDNGRTETVAGPAGWTGVSTLAYSDGAMNADPAVTGLRYDAALEPSGWLDPAASSAWTAVVPVPSAWGDLRPSQIPGRMEAEWPALGVTDVSGDVRIDGPVVRAGEGITLNGDASFTVKFSRVLSAYLSMQVDGAAGTVVTLLPKETYDQPAAERPLQVTLRDGTTFWESIGYDSFSEVKVRVQHATKPVHIAFLKAVFTSQPVQYRGSFESSDDHLNALWNAARWQTQISMQDRYLDSPNHQEPIGDPGDYLIASEENNYAFGDPWMAAQNLRQFAALLDQNNEVTFHASYPLFWVQMLLKHYQWTGDKALVAELAPSVDRLLAHLRTYRGANGLISEAPNYMFMDWIKVDGYNLHHPPPVIGQGYFTALYYQGLKDGAAIARLAGDTAKAAKYDNEARSLATTFNDELWDEDAGLYRDGKPFQNHQPLVHYLPADRDIVTHTDQVNIFAVLYGLASPERSREIMNRLLSHPRLNVQPYFMGFAFDAEAAVGLWDRYAWAQMQQWHLNTETKTFREMWFNGDWSHTWGGSPLVQMSSRVLGVTPGEPGYAVVRIAPHLAGLEWAKGVVPTPRGDVGVDWKQVPEGPQLTVSSPAQMPVVLDLSSVIGDARSVVVDGERRELAPQATYRLAAGQHVVAIPVSPAGR